MSGKTQKKDGPIDFSNAASFDGADMENDSPLDTVFANHNHSRRSIAAAVGVTVQAVMLWTTGLRKIRAETALVIEAKTGIPRSKLRPDLWPETVSGIRQKHKPPVAKATPSKLDATATIPRSARASRRAAAESG